MNAFAHLHLHTEYSLLDGACPIGKLLDLVKEQGMTSCAITDHGVMYGVVDFYTEALKRGIHPVIGCELYVCRDMEDKRSAAREYNHLIVLCENNEGYRNLSRMVSEAWTRGFYYKPRVDHKCLARYSKGLIGLSACLSGEIPRALLDGRDHEAREALKRYREIFGEDRFYLEIQDHGLADERRVLPRLVGLALEENVPLVATNDVHYLRREDAEAQEILMCIQTGKTLEDDNRMRMETRELFLKSPEEMAALFPQWPDAVARTAEIAARCNVDFDFKTIHLPHFPLPEGMTAEALLRSECSKGLARLYPGEPKEARDRLEYELGVIEQMGYVDYFLIVWDFIRFSKENGIMVGPGRGSGAGSIVAYTLGITAIDPLKYSLIFERFLNPERLSMPDLDIDFCYERRQEVIDYVARRYGEDHVAQIITFGTMAAKAVVRDVGRVLGYPYAEVDAVSKMIPFALGMTLEKALETNPEFRDVYENEERVRRLIDQARKLEGMPRHASTHAAGVLITNLPVTEYVPLQRNDEVITTQFPMGTLEKLGLLKMDFLGLRTLTVIRDTLDMMREAGVDMKAEDIPLDDPAVYEMISRGDTDGVFQMEGGGMRGFLSNMKPATLEDIIAAIALYRPGPMESIPRYIEGKRDPSTVRYADERLRPILDVTYGCMVYQEQVMQIVRDLAGYSMGRSDLVRRAMAKKKHDVMAQEREYFIHGLVENGQVTVPGAVRNGVPEEVAAHIFDEMTAFASYAFNKSHATGYAFLCVQTVWLKVRYPVQFLAALLNSVMGDAPKIAQYILTCRRSGIAVLPPDVNRSRRKFSVDTDPQTGKPAIRFGLGAVKNVGWSLVDAMEEERDRGGAFRDFFDFAHRMDDEHINKRLVECLIYAGAFDGLGANRAQLLAVYERVLDAETQQRRKNIAGQMSLFGDVLGSADTSIPIPDLPEKSLRTRLSLEKEVLGVYLSGNPLDEYQKSMARFEWTSATVAQLAEREDKGLEFDGRKISMAGQLTEVHTRATRSNTLMGFVTLEDMTGQVEGLVFPRVWERLGSKLLPDEAVVLEGRLSVREDEAPKLLVENVSPLEKDTQLENAAQGGGQVYLRLTAPDREHMDACLPLLRRWPGRTPVVFRVDGENGTLLAPKEYWCRLNVRLTEMLTQKLGEGRVETAVKQPRR